jgi:protein-L-isoaspartate(D-aspartate) O-methyltransferase
MVEAGLRWTYGREARRVSWATAIVMLATLTATAPGDALDDRADERARMVSVIEAHARTAIDALGRAYIDPRVLQVMAEVPRHLFVPASVVDEAYEDRPLAIGHGQTISQPFIVALMTDMLALEPDDVVLEVGTGSAYQAAVLAELVREVHTIEIIPALAEGAEERLARLGYANAVTYQGDGYYGVPGGHTFDAIMVTAATSQIPPPLIAQLKPGGRMVIPVGSVFLVQHLLLVQKDDTGHVSTRQTLPVRFVPLTRES